jgi:hypothetical protein
MRLEKVSNDEPLLYVYDYATIIDWSIFYNPIFYNPILRLFFR